MHANDQNLVSRKSSNSFTNLCLPSSTMTTAITYPIAHNEQNVETAASSSQKEKKFLKEILMINNNKNETKEYAKKKFTLFDKKTLKDHDIKQNKSTCSPSKTCTSPISMTPSLVNVSGGNNSQVFSNFLSSFNITSSNNKANNAAQTSPSRSISSENINLQNDANNNSGLVLNNKNKIAKMSSSKSMMAFKKIKNDKINGMTSNIIGDESEMNGERLASFMSTSSSTNNPTVRRRTKSSISPRRQTPVFDQNEATKNKESTENSSSSSISMHSKLAEWIEHSRSNNDRSCSDHQKSLWSSITSSFSLPYYIFLFMTILSIFFLCISPLPSFLNGFIFGFLMTFFILTLSLVYLVANFFLIKSQNQEDQRNSTIESIGLKRTKSKRLALNMPISNSNGNPNESNIYAGWVYEFIGDYIEREKNGFNSRLVYIVLSGSKLNIFVPSQEVSEKKLKQLSFDSNRNIPMFSLSSQKVIDFNLIQHKRISLYLTKNVRNQRKYIWSKKYPICIEYNEYDGQESNNLCEPKEELQNLSIRPPPPISSTPILSKLVIFARTCHEKEEWFWALKATIDSNFNSKNSISTRGSNTSLTDSPNESKSFLLVNNPSASNTNTINENPSLSEPETAQSQQYLHIGTRRVNYHNFVRTNILSIIGIGPGSSGMMTALTWFNVLLNRLSFDILNKPNWSAYIAKKLQRKLKRLRLPYFMESLTITEIDIGSTLPKFNSVPSVPSVDDAGLWIEFDVSYSGTIFES